MRKLLLGFGALHALMLAYDLAHPDRFLHADRAAERFGVVEAFAAMLRDGGDWVSFFSSHGIPGDWFPQALVYAVGGQYLVIAAQVALVLASICWVRAIALRAGLEPAHATAAAAVYGLLPHTLVFPHQLAAEAVFVPLVIFAFYATSGLAWGIAALVRPITMLWPFFQSVFLKEKRSGFLVLGILPLLIWMLFILYATGEFGMGRSSHDLGHNLYQRMHRIATALPESERPERRARGETTAGVGEYLAFVAKHPVAAATHSARDLATMGAKSGIERLVLDYLDLFPESRVAIQDTGEGWRAQVERRGPLAALKEMFLRQPGLILIAAAGALALVAGLLLALAATFHAVKNRDGPRLLLAAFVLYVFVTAQAIDAAQSRHRAPAEFALCILAVAGWLRLRRPAAAKNAPESGLMAADPLLSIPERRVVAVFDLDGTLTRGDTLFAFLWWALGPVKFLLRLPRALPWLAGLALKLVPRDAAKEGVLRAFLRGELREDLRRHGESFARERLPGLLRPGAVQRLAWHRDRHHHLALASASLDLYVQPWARAAGFDDVFCTHLLYHDGMATGALSGRNCRGEEKLRRLEEGYGDLSRLVLHGYGDTEDDRPFLDRCAEQHYQPFRAGSAGSAGASAREYIKLMRPHQWVKNAFVFVGLVFGHAWGVPSLVLAALLAFASFSLMSSAIYILNDYADRERDRIHPKKRNRPLAAGRISPRSALMAAGALALAAGILGYAAGPIVLLIVAGYAAMNVAYSFALKDQVILDVFIIAAGFLLRILAGTLGIGIPPSRWLLVCGLFVTLFLGFTKRRSELMTVSGEFITHRKALLHYSPALLDKVIAVCGAATLMSYSLYAMSPETVRLHGTENLVYTIPFVAYGLFRYLYLLHARQAGTDTSRDLLKDWHLAATVLAWITVTVMLIA